nr:unnamed protein product [Callosobruchus analis]
MANLRTACINIRSLYPKVNVLTSLLQSEDRDGRGGGIAVYVKIEIDVIFDRDSLKVDALENIWLSVNVSNIRINIAVLYPSTS